VNSPPTPFTIGEWLVQPQLNRLSRSGGDVVQLEPKMMDVLVCLARNPGDVVSREALIDAVWPEVFITESVLTRAIAGLRRALGDDARSPRFIETISKRGYRLIGPAAPTPLAPAVHRNSELPGGSYVVGQWVRAGGFYGRSAQLAEVLEGRRNGFWVVGTRRRGKTSFLKQLEHVATAQPERRLLPVFWDLQGVDGLEALAFSFEEALADAEPRLEDVGLTLGEIIDPDIFRMLGTLRRRLHADGRTLFLLCDEAEALRTLVAQSEAAIGRLRRALLAHDGVRTVISSGPRLWDLATGSATSPFLDGFLPPLYLGRLRPETSCALVRQHHLADDERPDLTDDDVDAICRWGGGHPFLLQLLSKRAVEHGDVERAVTAVAGDRSISSLFEVDLELLDDQQRSILSILTESKGARVEGDSPALVELEQLGLVGRDDAGMVWFAIPLFAVMRRQSRSDHQVRTDV
jgi:DNA-binding winged helix-turn-helix (wHTH) protein